MSDVETVSEFRLPLGVAIFISFGIVFCIWYGYYRHYLFRKLVATNTLQTYDERLSERENTRNFVYNNRLYVIEISDRTGGTQHAAGSVTDPLPPAYQLVSAKQTARNSELDSAPPTYEECVPTGFTARNFSTETVENRSGRKP